MEIMMKSTYWHANHHRLGDTMFNPLNGDAIHATVSYLHRKFNLPFSTRAK